MRTKLQNYDIHRVGDSLRAKNLEPHILQRISVDPNLSYQTLANELELSSEWISMIARKNGYKRIWKGKGLGWITKKC